jgi:diketogulonate reductase-like aldo/keto reductase
MYIKIPFKTLYTGARIPGIGLGTFGSDAYRNEDIAEAVKDAIKVGYRYIDCAACYGNEELYRFAIKVAVIIFIQCPEAGTGRVRCENNYCTIERESV